MSPGTFHWFTLFWSALAVPILNATQPIIGALQGWVTGPFQLCVLAYLVCMLLIAAWSDDDEVALKFLRNLFLAVVVYTLAATAGPFGTFVTGLANGLVTSISTALAGVFGGGTATSAQTFDTVANSLIAVGVVVLKHVPAYAIIRGLVLGMVVDVYVIGSVLAIGLLFGVFMISSVILQFLLAFGPLFIACYFFPFTRQFFDGWLRVVVAAIVTEIFISGLMTLFVTAINTLIVQFSVGLNGGDGGAVGGDIINEIVTLCVAVAICFIFAFLGFYLSRLAQSIAGGAHANFAKLPNFRDLGSS